jgi:hypothetical protein
MYIVQSTKYFEPLDSFSPRKVGYTHWGRLFVFFSIENVSKKCTKKFSPINFPKKSAKRDFPLQKKLAHGLKPLKIVLQFCIKHRSIT